MKLETLEKYNDIVIQMHDNPDADAVGSGYAIYRYFQAKGKRVRLIYGGRQPITKSNMKLLLQELAIPVEYVQELEAPELLLTVDCQYGEGNVQRFEAQNIAMIDHHNTGRVSDAMSEIRSHIVSCATICYDLLLAEGFDVNADIRIATALYYGLYMDSKELSEIRHPLERDMIDFLHYDRVLVRRLNHANFTIDEMETAGIAMIRHSYDENKRLSIIKSNPCDPNILGLVGDLVLQVDSIDVCIIFNECPGGFKLSVRSCAPDVAANELARFLTAGIGDGGGHLDKAGGFISKRQYEKRYGEKGIESFFFQRVDEYYDSYDVIYAKDGVKDVSGFCKYRKKAYICGFVRTTEVVPAGTVCRIRTLEGDATVTAGEDIYLMIGYFGEVYPIERVVFERKYRVLDASFEKSFEYPPTLITQADGKTRKLLPFAKQCIVQEEVRVFARELCKDTKVFTKWDYEKYMAGEAGDMLCYTEGDAKDLYIIKKNVFGETYEEAE
ncbi:MAG: DHH family phosphoesterase [Lachnospiraceae bacterium]|nr:DHH family phosphoesterase [Lachnospiraceae bacterium]